MQKLKSQQKMKCDHGFLLNKKWTIRLNIKKMNICSIKILKLYWENERKNVNEWGNDNRDKSLLFIIGSQQVGKSEISW